MEIMPRQYLAVNIKNAKYCVDMNKLAQTLALKARQKVAGGSMKAQTNKCSLTTAGLRRLEDRIIAPKLPLTEDMIATKAILSRNTIRAIRQKKAVSETVSLTSIRVLFQALGLTLETADYHCGGREAEKNVSVEQDISELQPIEDLQGGEAYRKSQAIISRQTDAPTKKDRGILREGAGYSPTDSVNHWVSRFTDEYSPIRHLLITGPGGRGKTFFARQIQLELKEIDRHGLSLWLDCADEGSILANLKKLLRPLIPTGRVSEFDENYPEYTNDLNDVAEFDSNSAIADVLGETLFSSNADPVYFYLDDLDRYETQLGSEKSAIASFVNTFGGADSCLRIITTIRGSELAESFFEQLPVTSKFKGRTDGDLKDFSLEKKRQYLEGRGGVKKALEEKDWTRFITLVPGDPLLLDQVEDTLLDKKLTKQTDWLLSLLGKCCDATAPEEERLKCLRNEVFDKQFERLTPDARKVADALAVLVDFRYVPFSPEMLLEPYSTMEALLDAVVEPLRLKHIATHIRELRSRNILEKKGYRFYLDSLQEYILSNRVRDDVKERLHTKAMEATQRMGRMEYAVWHQLAIGKTNEAFDSLCLNIYPLEASFKYVYLSKLQECFRQVLWGTKGWRWAVNQGKLAETLYKGFGIKNSVGLPTSDPSVGSEQSEWQLFRDMVLWCDKNRNIVREWPKEPALKQFIIDTYLRCRVMQTIFVFENPGNQITEDDPMYKYVSPRHNDWLALQIDTILDEVRRNNASIAPPMLANLACLQGCFYNGGGEYNKAIPAFETAEKYLTDYNTAIKRRSKQLSSEQQLRLEQDLLEFASCCSRSRFLDKGVDYAVGQTRTTKPTIHDFQHILDNVSTELSHSVEYTYSLVNLCYYLLGKHDFVLMRHYLSQAYKDGEEPQHIIRPDEDKWVKESWIEWYVDALEVAYHFYNPINRSPERVMEAKQALESIIQRFQSDGSGYSRDQQMFIANRFMFDLAWNTDVEQRKKLISDFDEWLYHGKKGEIGQFGRQDIHSEPIVNDTLVYLKACVAAIDGIPESDPGKSVQRTQLRFPGFLDHKRVSFHNPEWHPPYLLRGALQMRPNPCAPFPAELGIVDL